MYNNWTVCWVQQCQQCVQLVTLSTTKEFSISGELSLTFPSLGLPGFSPGALLPCITAKPVMPCITAS